MECNCKDWEENINKVNAAFVLQTARGYGGYEGKVFVYCPWCGEKLIKEETDEQSSYNSSQ